MGDIGRVLSSIRRSNANDKAEILSRKEIMSFGDLKESFYKRRYLQCGVPL